MEGYVEGPQGASLAEYSTVLHGEDVNRIAIKVRINVVVGVEPLAN